MLSSPSSVFPFPRRSPSAAGSATPAVSVWPASGWSCGRSFPATRRDCAISRAEGEAAPLFPANYLHVGGDEAVKDQWKASARVQERIRELGVKDEAGLQSSLSMRLEKFLVARHKSLIGWD